ncbi:ABC transporter permease [Phaeodactylibacter sp.]|jgi:putative ABC transport system permease protein|uniref:ABC transporter permease n=1 Tax=Phaeodactylibacter sp. TaxID=1940289 RepID=UPI0025E10FF7|nr:ABC transporter permease [Phaeodactylibacter sp.]MCI4648620.1 ABC transporter permease [Phaeodactylibacter sp.]MCI5094122.1 ABC transporter permease [Phaeodactylibacter sp.]
MQRVLFNFLLAVEGVNANKLRSFLTALGIIFGVGAVIAMLAIGTGAKQAILDQMKLIGTNNIVITSVVPESGDEISTENEEEEEKKPYSPGLSLADLASIQKTVPTVDRLSPEIILPVSVVRAGRQEKGRCIGVENDFFELNGLEIGQGIAFQPVHMEKGEAVCIIGTEVKKRFFSEEDPVGKLIKCGKTWLRVIGVLKKRNASEESLARLGIRDYNSDVYIPVSTALLRFRNRALITPDDLGNNDENKAKNYHQLDRLVVRVDDSKKLRASADVIARILQRRHLQVPDVEIEVPELLLEQEQQTQETFNLVLAVIAGISLLVGGIGIMNIMLASVLERIKEIGVRRSLGATQLDIILQFLFEAVFISLIGGLIGVLLGVGAAKTIASYAEIPTIVSAWSILLSFGVAASIGLVFGLFPAQKAAKQDPIKALRSD